MIAAGDDTAAPNTALDLRQANDNEYRYLLSTWLEEYKFSSAKHAKTPFDAYRALVTPRLAAVLQASSILVASRGDRILGWLAYIPGKRVGTVHWVHTRFHLEGERIRRRGVMSLLLEAAGLGDKLVYTHRGSMVKRHRGGAGRTKHFDVKPPSVDVPIVEHLKQRGVTAVYIDYSEWVK